MAQPSLFHAVSDHCSRMNGQITDLIISTIHQYFDEQVQNIIKRG
jgi:hypothetical protein